METVDAFFRQYHSPQVQAMTSGIQGQSMVRANKIQKVLVLQNLNH